jgi:ribosomal protein S18 acetylase RimI-like enzyme
MTKVRGSKPDASRLMAAIDVTWPAGEVLHTEGWTLRRGFGGGKRVSAASGAGEVSVAEAGMRAWGQPRLFRLTAEEAELDAQLGQQSYEIVDPVLLYAASAGALVGEQSHTAAAYTCEFRPAIIEEIWARTGIGPARLAVMDRPDTPRSFLMSRVGDRPAGAAFVALDQDVAMIHAIEVLPERRRQGAGRLLMEAAARFAVERGADWLALAVVEDNVLANSLYSALGMEVVGRYHYRMAAGEANT